MKKLLSKIIAVAAMFVISLPLQAADTLIHAKRLIDGVSDKVIESVSILIIDNNIASIQKGFVTPNQSQTLVNLKKFLELI